jgi:hypothetical protein
VVHDQLPKRHLLVYLSSVSSPTCFDRRIAHSYLACFHLFISGHFNMRKRPGIGAIQKQRVEQERFRDKGTELQENLFEQVL